VTLVTPIIKTEPKKSALLAARRSAALKRKNAVLIVKKSAAKARKLKKLSKWEKSSNPSGLDFVFDMPVWSLMASDGIFFVLLF